MLFPLLLTLFVASVSARLAPAVLQHDDVLLFARDGSVHVMKNFDYQLLEAKAALHHRKAQQQQQSQSQPDQQLSAVNKRCDESTEYQVLTDTMFTDWDVAMSPVLGATGSTNASIAVTKGYTLANSFYVSALVSHLSYVSPTNRIFRQKGNNAVSRALLDALLGTDLDAGTTTWTTSDDQTFTFAVPPGQYGLVVSNPYARRVAGNMLSGCTDAPDVEAWSSTTYTSQSYTGMEWVSGPITMCNSSVYPVPYCIGEGSHM